MSEDARQRQLSESSRLARRSAIASLDEGVSFDIATVSEELRKLTRRFELGDKRTQTKALE